MSGNDPRIVIITGASAGVGRAIARRFARAPSVAYGAGVPQAPGN